MKIDHLAIWVNDLEKMKDFYEKYFEAKAGALYLNSKKGFKSYFLSFETQCRLEIMTKIGIPAVKEKPEQEGMTHFAMSVGSKEGVDQLTEELRADGFAVVGEARTTGDGYYESVVLDPENNRIEITD